MFSDNTTSIPIETPANGTGQFDWLKDGHSEPFAFLNTNFDSSQVVDSFPSQWTSTSFWDDFQSFLVPQINTSPFNPATATGLESRLMYVPGTTDNPMRRGVSLAEICESARRSRGIADIADARVVESWLVGLPSTARDYARARIMALNDNNSECVLSAGTCADPKARCERSDMQWP